MLIYVKQRSADNIWWTSHVEKCLTHRQLPPILKFLILFAETNGDLRIPLVVNIPLLTRVSANSNTLNMAANALSAFLRSFVRLWKTVLSLASLIYLPNLFLCSN